MLTEIANNVSVKPYSSTYCQYCTSSASSTNATCTAVAFVKYVDLTAVKHALKITNKSLICHVKQLYC